jgi:hypothetical protein
MTVTVSLRELALFTLVVALGIFVLGSVVFGWTNPAQNPPGGNVAAPLNAGGASQTKSGNLSVNQLTATVAEGTAPLVVTSQTKVANLNADLLDGLDSSGFGDATLSNQSSILSKIGSSTDAGSLTPDTLFAGIKGIISKVDASYITTATLMGIGSAPACPGGWSEIVGQTAAGSIAPVTSINSTTISPLTSLTTIGVHTGNSGLTYTRGCSEGTCTPTSASLGNSSNYTVAQSGSATTYTLYYRLCGLPG